MTNSLIVVAKVSSNTLKFLQQKCKCTHIFSAKNINILTIFQKRNVNIMLVNNFVKF